MIFNPLNVYKQKIDFLVELVLLQNKLKELGDVPDDLEIFDYMVKYLNIIFNFKNNLFLFKIDTYKVKDFNKVSLEDYLQQYLNIKDRNAINFMRRIQNINCVKNTINRIDCSWFYPEKCEVTLDNLYIKNDRIINKARSLKEKYIYYNNKYFYEPKMEIIRIKNIINNNKYAIMKLLEIIIENFNVYVITKKDFKYKTR